jgi:hypothetical protein
MPLLGFSFEHERVWLQTLPISNLAHQLQRYMPSGRSENLRNIGTAGIVGGIVGSMFDNDR